VIFPKIKIGGEYYVVCVMTKLGRTRKVDGCTPRKCIRDREKNVSFSKAIYISTEIVKSQNHRILEVGRDLWRLTSAAPLLKQG